MKIPLAEEIHDVIHTETMKMETGLDVIALQKKKDHTNAVMAKLLEISERGYALIISEKQRKKNLSGYFMMKWEKNKKNFL